MRPKKTHCNCGVELVPENMYAKVRGICKTCHKKRCAENRRNLPAEAKKEMYRRQTERLRDKGWAYWKYGITLDQYAAMLEAQNGLCALCEQREPKHIDHCHETGRVRGLLCPSCNTALGKFDDNPALLRKAMSYLER